MKGATDPGSNPRSNRLALVILTGHYSGGSEWALVDERLRDVASTLAAGDAAGARRSLAAARDAAASLGRATTEAAANADAIRAALDQVQALLAGTDDDGSVTESEAIPRAPLIEE